LKTASANDNVIGSVARDASVEVVDDGAQSTAIGSNGIGIRTARPAAVATTPP
jgi:hypothetical protein